MKGTPFIAQRRLRFAIVPLASASTAPALPAPTPRLPRALGDHLPYPCELHTAFQRAQGGWNPLCSSLQGSFSVSPPEHTRPKPSVAISVCKAPGSPGLGGGKEILDEIFYSQAGNKQVHEHVLPWLFWAGSAGRYQARTGTQAGPYAAGCQPSSALRDHSHPALGHVCVVGMCETGCSDTGGLKGHQKAGAGPGCSPTACTYCTRFDFCSLFAWWHGVTQTHATAG